MSGPPAAAATGSPGPRPWVEPLGRALAEALPRLYAVAPDPLLVELLQALTAALARGELEVPLQGPAPEGISEWVWPEGQRRALARSGLADDRSPAGPPGPLLLTALGVGWRRWLEQLDTVLADLHRRALAPLTQPLDPQQLERAVEVAGRRGGLDGRQRQAVAALLRHRLVLLGGGPGTGKTSTVVQMLAASLELRPDLRLHLAAPTGKAAARLRQAIGERAGTLTPLLAGRLAAVPCTTLHRLLESRGESFGRDRDHPLALDLLVVDEVSMLDLPLTAALLDALPAEAQLLLVGDPAQLPPVGPGAVLSELYQPPRLAGLGEAAIQLATTYRNDGAIARAAERLRRGDLDGLLDTLRQLEAADNLCWWRCRPPQLPPQLGERLRAHQDRLRQLARQWDPTELESGLALLREVDSFVVLAPTRRGPWGVEALHRRQLGAAERLGTSAWPLGTPVLCQRNLSEQGLANGDVGVVVELEGQRRLLFGGSDALGAAALRLIHPSRLAGAEPALALTIHKAQGSQYREVVVLMPESLPGDGGREATRDGRLLYTALTRAQQEAVLITPDQLDWLPAAVEQPISG